MNYITDNNAGRRVQKYTALIYLFLAVTLVFTVIFFTSYDSEYVDNHERLDSFDFRQALLSFPPRYLKYTRKDCTARRILQTAM